jgi:hypothetical protein
VPPNLPDYQKLITALNAESVRFVIVGGIAMVLHGSDYTTVDFDFAVATDLETADQLVRALAPFEPRPSHLPDFRDFPWDRRSIYGAVVSLITSAGDIDILRTIPGVDSFVGLWERSQARFLYGEEVRVASLADLISMKQAANRPKDIQHVIELRTLSSLEENEPNAR